MEFTSKDLKALKRLYKESVKRGKDQFEFRGNTLLTSYAKYLIEYLETKFKK